MFARYTHIREYAHLNRVTFNDETMRITCIMEFGKRSYRKCADTYGFISKERNDQMFINGETAVLQCGCGNINGKLIFFREPWNAEYMIHVFMRNKKSFYFFY